MALYHYTCDHSHGLILAEGVLRPRPGYLPRPLVWLTDLPTPNRDGLGLTSHTITCDRTAYRYRVTDDSRVLPWLEVRRDFPRVLVNDLESVPGVRLRHWFISEDPVPVVFDPRGAVA